MNKRNNHTDDTNFKPFIMSGTPTLGELFRISPITKSMNALKSEQHTSFTDKGYDTQSEDNSMTKGPFE